MTLTLISPLAEGSLDPKMVAFVVAFLVISLGVHEAAHAWMANLCGDSTAKDLGRMTLNPFPHIDPFMTLVLPAVLFFTTGFAFGGAKPARPKHASRPRSDDFVAPLIPPFESW